MGLFSKLFLILSILENKDPAESLTRISSLFSGSELPFLFLPNKEFNSTSSFLP